jgi:hypothetical protein
VNIHDYTHLRSEQTALRRMLAELPPESVLDRSGLAGRLEEVEELLASAGKPRRGPARAHLTFRGHPVIDQHGVFAEFGTRATSLFTDAVSKIVASQSGPLAATGPIPHRSDSQLLITSTAVGSFGFELEEHRPNVLDFGDDSPLDEALEVTSGLLDSTLKSDDDLADYVAATDPRAVAAVREFLDYLAANEAICAVEYNDRVVRFRDVGEIRRAADRLSQDNVHEEEIEVFGQFLGVLPEGRRFEFRLSDTQEIVRGTIGHGVAEPAMINQHLLQAVKIAVLTTQVGSGKPRYKLLQSPSWPGGT